MFTAETPPSPLTKFAALQDLQLGFDKLGPPGADKGRDEAVSPMKDSKVAMETITQTFDQTVGPLLSDVENFLAGRLEVGDGDYILGLRDDRLAGPSVVMKMNRLVARLVAHIDEATGTAHFELLDMQVAIRCDAAEPPCKSFVWLRENTEFHLILNDREKAPWVMTEVCERPRE